MTPWRVVPGMTFLGVARVMTSWKSVPEMINLHAVEVTTPSFRTLASQAKIRLLTSIPLVTRSISEG